MYSTLINSIRDQLAKVLAPHFIVHIEEQVYIEMPDIYVRSGRLPSDTHAPAGVTESPTLSESLYEPEIRERIWKSTTRAIAQSSR